MANRSLGAQISAMLKDRGVSTIFGIPGVHNIELYRGLEESGLRHVLARHEQGAGFMADGYARATGRAGVAFVISGPGLTNIMTPMGQAHSDSVPMLVISSCLDETAAKRGQLHQMRDQRAAAETVCDWSEEARTPEAAYALIDRALGEFQAHRARPKHMQIAIGRLGAPAPVAPARAPAIHRATDTANWSEVAGLLAGATRPLVIVGGGARHAAGVLRELTERLGAASFCSYAGRGVISPQSVLHFGPFLGRLSSADVIATTDLVLVFGCELSETDLWRSDLGLAAPMIRVDRDPVVLAAHPASEIGLLADSFDAAATMLDIVAERPAKTGWDSAEITAARARWSAEVDAERPGIVPIADALRAALPKNTMVFSDMTQFAYVAKEVWDMPEPGLWHHPTGFGTLGYALPAAIGGKVGVGEQHVIAIAGDYGFQYTMQELGTAAELGLSLPILLWDNQMLKEIEASMARTQIAPVAVKAMNPDFGTLAAAYGIGYAKPVSLEDLQAAVRAALAADGPTLIHMTPELAR